MVFISICNKQNDTRFMSQGTPWHLLMVSSVCTQHYSTPPIDFSSDSPLLPWETNCKIFPSLWDILFYSVLVAETWPVLDVFMSLARRTSRSVRPGPQSHQTRCTSCLRVASDSGAHNGSCRGATNHTTKSNSHTTTNRTTGSMFSVVFTHEIRLSVPGPRLDSVKSFYRDGPYYYRD